MYGSRIRAHRRSSHGLLACDISRLRLLRCVDSLTRFCGSFARLTYTIGTTLPCALSLPFSLVFGLYGVLLQRQRCVQASRDPRQSPPSSIVPPPVFLVAIFGMNSFFHLICRLIPQGRMGNCRTAGGQVACLPGRPFLSPPLDFGVMQEDFLVNFGTRPTTANRRMSYYVACMLSFFLFIRTYPVGCFETLPLFAYLGP